MFSEQMGVESKAKLADLRCIDCMAIHCITLSSNTVVPAVMNLEMLRELSEFALAGDIKSRECPAACSAGILLSVSLLRISWIKMELQNTTFSQQERQVQSRIFVLPTLTSPIPA